MTAPIIYVQKSEKLTLMKRKSMKGLLSVQSLYQKEQIALSVVSIKYLSISRNVL